jgi:subtilase family serine protease
MAAVLCAPAAMAPLGSSSAAASGPAGVVPTVVVGPVVGRSLSQIPSSEFCLEYFGFACYTPSDIQNQYDFPALYGEGITGAGQTIVIFDSFGSPTIRQDLAVFDQESSLPDPPSFDIYMPEGSSTVNFVRVPKTSDFDHNHLAQQRGWAYETTLDVEWAHALAPGANIALVTIPLSETGGVQGLPNMQHAQAFALSHGLGSIWSDSWSATEQGFGSATPILNLDRLYAQAAAAGVSAFFGTGDTGSANVNRQGHVFPYATVTYPPSSAHVVAVGGTGVTTPVGSISTYQPESVWDTPPTESGGGGGYSSVFPEPSYQVGAGIPDPSGMRGIPDVSMNAADTSAVLVFESFDPLLGVGFVPIAGTSEATPLWAATDAVMNQADGPLGFLTPRLYQIYENPGLYSEAFHDITVGNNSVGGVPGFSAGPGWDAASGLGTPDAVGLAQALAQTTP